MIRLADFHYVGVPRLGTVLFSADVLIELHQQELVTDGEISDTLAHGNDVRARTDRNLVGREHNGIRLVIRTRPYMEGAAAVCINGYRVK